MSDTKDPHFDGETYDPEKDHSRLTQQLAKVRDLMLDGKWRTLAQIAEEVGAPEASVSARLRDLRKSKFGNFKVGRQRVPGDKKGLHVYRVSYWEDDIP